MAIDLSGLIRAGLAGATGYLGGEQAKREADEKRAIAEQERARQAHQDALRDALLKAQTDANNALALQRRTPDAPPAPKVSIQAGADGTLYRVDEATGEATPVTYQGKPVKRRVPQGSVAGPKPPTGTQMDDEAQGRAIMQQMGASGSAPIENKRAFWQAYVYATQQNPGLSEGRAAKQVMDALKQSRPDLFRQAAGWGDFPTPSPATPTPAPVPQPRTTTDTTATLPSTLTADEVQALRQAAPSVDDPKGWLRSNGYSDAEIKVILGG